MSPAEGLRQLSDVLVIVDLLPDGTVQKSRRWNAVRPPNGKRSDVNHVLDVAADQEHYTELLRLWEKTHGLAAREQAAHGWKELWVTLEEVHPQH